jgi:putative FmdB family regulatory protein
MPVYEYRCTAHGHQFEVFQPVGAEAPTCPVCDSPTRKVFSSVGVIFKGAGFHTTDYRRSGSEDGKAAPEGTPAAKSDGAKTEGAKTETAKSDGKSATSGTAKEGGSGKPTGAAKT